MNADIFVLIEHLHGKVADISYTMLAAAGKLADALQAQVTGILLCEDASALPSDFAADRVLLLEDPSVSTFQPDATKAVLTHLIREHLPRVVLFGNTAISAELACSLSIRLDLPLLHACHHITGSNTLVSQICGGKILVEVDLPDQTLLATVVPGGFSPDEGRRSDPPKFVSITAPPLPEPRIHLERFYEPGEGDVDITKAEVLVAIGRGIQNPDNIDLATDLAEALGGEVCASRPIIDQGWLPPSRLVGKSGKRVNPRVYLAFGISGAPEHVEGMSDSEIIIAVNSDPDAPIFHLAHYGAVVDMLDVMEIMAGLVRALEPA